MYFHGVLGTKRKSKTRFQSIVTIIWIWSSIKNEDLKSNSSKKQSFLSRISFFRFFRKLKKKQIYEKKEQHTHITRITTTFGSQQIDFFFKKTLDLDNLCYFKKKKNEVFTKNIDWKTIVINWNWQINRI